MKIDPLLMLRRDQANTNSITKCLNFNIVMWPTIIAILHFYEKKIDIVFGCWNKIIRRNLSALAWRQRHP